MRNCILIRPVDLLLHETAENKQVAMENIKTPFVCGICGKKYHNLASLGKHVELRHPIFPKNSSILPKASIETQTNFSNDSQENLLQSKINDKESESANELEIITNDADPVYTVMKSYS